jgi:protein ImuA
MRLTGSTTAGVGLDGDKNGDDRSERIAALREVMERLERAPRLGKVDGAIGFVAGSLGPQCEWGVPGPGLAIGALNEVIAGTAADRPPALGFMLSLTAAAQRTAPGPVVFIATERAFADLGALYGHGLAYLGVDVGRLLLVDPETDKDTLWALEETLRSRTQPAMVVGVLAGGIDLTLSRRLNLAAAPHRVPLVLMRRTSAGTSAAATRWRIATAPAARDRFGILAHFRWQVSLERCRNGRTGAWLIEWDHVARRFNSVDEMTSLPQPGHQET